MGFLESLQPGIIGAARAGPVPAVPGEPFAWPVASGSRGEEEEGWGEEEEGWGSQGHPPGETGAAGAGDVLGGSRLCPCRLPQSPLHPPPHGPPNLPSPCFHLRLVISPSTALITFLPWHRRSPQVLRH